MEITAIGGAPGRSMIIGSLPQAAQSKIPARLGLSLEGLLIAMSRNPEYEANYSYR
jgi:hypothetical protein